MCEHEYDSRFHGEGPLATYQLAVNVFPDGYEEEVESVPADSLADLYVRGGGPTVDDPDRAYCKPDQSCCDYCCGN